MIEVFSPNYLYFSFFCCTFAPDFDLEEKVHAVFCGCKSTEIF